jgi:hypothetical protein
MSEHREKVKYVVKRSHKWSITVNDYYTQIKQDSLQTTENDR